MIEGDATDDLVEAIGRIKPPPASREHALCLAVLLLTSGWRHAVTVMIYWCMVTTGHWDRIHAELKPVPNALGKGERPSIDGVKYILDRRLWDDETARSFVILMRGVNVDACAAELGTIQQKHPVAWRSAGGHCMYHDLQLCRLIPGLRPVDLAEEGSERSHQAIKHVRPLRLAQASAKELLQRVRILEVLREAGLMHADTGRLIRPQVMGR